jgi:hypothetical protein
VVIKTAEAAIHPCWPLAGCGARLWGRMPICLSLPGSFWNKGSKWPHFQGITSQLARAILKHPFMSQDILGAPSSVGEPGEEASVALGHLG